MIRHSALTKPPRWSWFRRAAGRFHGKPARSHSESAEIFQFAKWKYRFSHLSHRIFPGMTDLFGFFHPRNPFLKSVHFQARWTSIRTWNRVGSMLRVAFGYELTYAYYLREQIVTLISHCSAMWRAMLSRKTNKWCKVTVPVGKVVIILLASCYSFLSSFSSFLVVTRFSIISIISIRRACVVPYI